MEILITGGTGFIGSRLVAYLEKQGHIVSILTRNTQKKSSSSQYVTTLDPQHSYECIVNLAGESLVNKRWTDAVKQEIYESRIHITQTVIDYIKATVVKPKTLLSGSAIGFYGHDSDTTFVEDSAPASDDFSHRLCRDWENAALQARALGVRVCLLRTGIVLGKQGGALKQMLPAFKLGLGAQLGQGHQWMSWIHLEDMVAAIEYLIDHQDLEGPFNMTAPQPETNQAFSQELATALHRPFWLTLPAPVVTLFFGEMGKILLLEGPKVIPEKLSTAGFQFKFPTLGPALRNIL